uniref:Uncharacterized protein n=1 Tax=Corethron hystrix TaxID=216773 RepID=A0A6U5FRT5_9STRA|mmetsp:Transcript_24267/g.55269  ORF Transcript_24267/g.55269 Transcript_24267/m.55269 type:complete len:102 (+) Transcript_24267:925-1230(+)
MIIFDTLLLDGSISKNESFVKKLILELDAKRTRSQKLHSKKFWKEFPGDRTTLKNKPMSTPGQPFHTERKKWVTSFPIFTHPPGCWYGSVHMEKEERLTCE